MNIKKLLEELVHYYGYSRQVGHTTAMCKGAENTENGIVITHNQNMKRYLEDYITNPDIKYVTLNDIERCGGLRGFAKPIMFDNAALFEVLNSALNTIKNLEDTISDYKSTVFTTKTPLGLTPRYIKDSERLKEISAAIFRYTEVGKKIPDEWIEEMVELNERISLTSE